MSDQTVKQQDLDKSGSGAAYRVATVVLLLLLLLMSFLWWQARSQRDGALEQVTRLEREVAELRTALEKCQGDLKTCQSDLTACQGDLTACQGDLQQCTERNGACPQCPLTCPTCPACNNTCPRCPRCDDRGKEKVCPATNDDDLKRCLRMLEEERVKRRTCEKELQTSVRDTLRGS